MYFLAYYKKYIYQPEERGGIKRERKIVLCLVKNFNLVRV